MCGLFVALAVVIWRLGWPRTLLALAVALAAWAMAGFAVTQLVVRLNRRSRYRRRSFFATLPARSRSLMAEPAPDALQSRSYGHGPKAASPRSICTTATSVSPTTPPPAHRSGSLSSTRTISSTERLWRSLSGPTSSAGLGNSPHWSVSGYCDTVARRNKFALHCLGGLFGKLHHSTEGEILSTRPAPRPPRSQKLDISLISQKARMVEVAAHRWAASEAGMTAKCTVNRWLVKAMLAEQTDEWGSCGTSA